MPWELLNCTERKWESHVQWQQWWITVGSTSFVNLGIARWHVVRSYACTQVRGVSTDLVHRIRSSSIAGPSMLYCLIGLDLCINCIVGLHCVRLSRQVNRYSHWCVASVAYANSPMEIAAMVHGMRCVFTIAEHVSFTVVVFGRSCIHLAPDPALICHKSVTFRGYVPGTVEPHKWCW
jgi:hypothetical protein